MTVPTKAAMKQLLDERMIAGSASNWLPPAMFFLQLNLSGVIILLSLMFYANALGESFVRGLVVGFFFFFFLLFSCVRYVWVHSLVKLGWVRGSVGGVGGGMAFGSYVHACVCVCASVCVCLWVFSFFFKHYENICILLSPACVVLIISCMHRGFLSWRSHDRSHITRRQRRRRSSPAACHSQRALLQQSQRVEHLVVPWPQIALDPWQAAYWHKTKCNDMISSW